MLKHADIQKYISSIRVVMEIISDQFFLKAQITEPVIPTMIPGRQKRNKVIIALPSLMNHSRCNTERRKMAR
jgi:hypothetical protein